MIRYVIASVVFALAMWSSPAPAQPPVPAIPMPGEITYASTDDWQPDEPQWHNEEATGDVAQGHTHLRVWAPEYATLASGECFNIPAQVVVFNPLWPANVNQARVTVFGPNRSASVRLTKDDFPLDELGVGESPIVYLPVCAEDFKQSGRQTVLMSVVRQGPDRQHRNNVRWPIYVDNGAPAGPTPQSQWLKTCNGISTITPGPFGLGYGITEFLSYVPRVIAEPITIPFKLRRALGAGEGLDEGQPLPPVRGRVQVDPLLHHGDDGIVLFDETHDGPSIQGSVVFDPKALGLASGPHRIVIRADTDGAVDNVSSLCMVHVVVP